MLALLHARWVEVLAASELARSLLAGSLPRRWGHTQGVARRARELAALVGADAGLLEAAAWLHDIGYAPGLVETGFHPLDGARYLRARAVSDRRLLTLVAHHSCAVVEAEVRGILSALLEEFPLDEGDVGDLLESLTYCDMTTDPQGRGTQVGARVAEILQRYQPEDPVHRAIASARPGLFAICERVAQRTSRLRSR